MIRATVALDYGGSRPIRESDCQPYLTRLPICTIPYFKVGTPLTFIASPTYFPLRIDFIYRSMLACSQLLSASPGQDKDGKFPIAMQRSACTFPQAHIPRRPNCSLLHTPLVVLLLYFYFWIFCSWVMRAAAALRQLPPKHTANQNQSFSFFLPL